MLLGLFKSCLSLLALLVCLFIFNVHCPVILAPECPLCSCCPFTWWILQLGFVVFVNKRTFLLTTASCSPAFGSQPHKNATPVTQTKLKNLKKTVGSVLGTVLELMVQSRICHKMKNIMDNPEHPLHNTVIQQQCLQLETSSDLLQHRPLQTILPEHSYNHL